MLALIPAGGKGSRLGMGEKPLVTICGTPMIQYVVDAFVCAGHEPVVIVSPHSPFTANWCRAHQVGLYTAQGVGYIEDLVEAGCALEAKGPLFTCVADLPLITPGTIGDINREYQKRGTPAVSVWVPALDYRFAGPHREYSVAVSGSAAYPVGLNILRGEQIVTPQEESRILTSDVRLACNVNTRGDLERVERVLCPTGKTTNKDNLKGNRPEKPY